MKKNWDLPIWLPAAVVLVFATASSRAVIETEALSPISFGTSPFPEMLNLPGFNSSLGTLTGISITVTETTTMQAEVVNFGQATSFTGATATGTTTLSGLLGLTYSDVFSSTPFSGSIPDGTSSPAFVHGPLSPGTSSQTAPIPSIDFGAYEYSGSPSSVPFNVNFSGTYTGTGTEAPAALYFGGNATISGMIDVTYTYDTSIPPVPEAGTVWAGLCALICSGMALRSRAGALRF